VITVALTATIGAPSERVWRALVDPHERIAWDERVLGEVVLPAAGRARRPTRSREPASADPVRGARSRNAARKRWRFRLGGVPLVLQDETISVEDGERIASRISIGSMHFDQTLTLHREDDETGPRTRLGMKLVVHNSIVVIGDVVPRLDVQRLAIEYVDTTLRQVQQHCEADR